MPLPGDMGTLHIVKNDYLPPSTILVSPDIWEIMRETYAEEGRDRSFLRAIGILTDEHPPREGESGGSE